jgi:hypothetical protein
MQGENKIYQGKHYNTPVTVLNPVPDSRTLFEVQENDRGPGWDETKQKYIGVKFTGGWMRGENHAFGRVFIAHKNKLA